MKIIEKEELMKIIPHKGKMFLLDRIIDWNVEKGKISSETKIDENFMFYEESVSGVLPYVLFEMSAQTIAALLAIANDENEKNSKMGFLLSVSNMKFSKPVINCGSCVVINATQDSDVGDVYSFVADFLVNGEMFGSGKFTVLASYVKQGH